MWAQGIFHCEMFVSSAPKLSKQYSLRTLRCFSMITANPQWKELSSMFPELLRAEGEEVQGNFPVALDIITNIHDIMSNATGKRSQPTVLLTEKKCLILRRMGSFTKLEQFLVKSGSFAVNDTHKIAALHEVTIARLQSGALNSSIEAVDDSIECCERLHAEPHQFFKSYSLKGLVSMFQGDHDGAEMYLQMAARWAPSHSDQIASLINLGASKLAQSYPAPHFDTSGRVQTSFLHSLALNPTPGDRDGDDGVKVAGVNKGVTNGLDDAAGYLEEAMDIALSTGPAETPSSMCGPGQGGGGASQEPVGILGPDGSVPIVRLDSAAASLSPPDASAAPTAGDTLERRLQTRDFAILYATLLTNAAEMYVMKEDLGSAGGGGGGVGRSSELLAAALKALEGHTASPPCAPALGRTLSNIASLHARAAQAVTAEGLLTSALDRLSSPYATHDCRFQYERAVALVRNGALLQKWDKRESKGVAMVQEAEALVQRACPPFTGGLRLSPFVVFPIS